MRHLEPEGQAPNQNFLICLLRPIQIPQFEKQSNTQCQISLCFSNQGKKEIWTECNKQNFKSGIQTSSPLWLQTPQMCTNDIVRIIVLLTCYCKIFSIINTGKICTASFIKYPCTRVRVKKWSLPTEGNYTYLNDGGINHPHMNYIWLNYYMG